MGTGFGRNEATGSCCDQLLLVGTASYAERRARGFFVGPFGETDAWVCVNMVTCFWFPWTAVEVNGVLAHSNVAICYCFSCSVVG